jgi:hypothetical protein
MKIIKIIVATHKPYQMPEDDIYLPVQVGADRHDVDLGYAKDNTGDNISVKNPYYCELTALYWAWKNLESDYVGLSHYRRHFIMRNSKDKWQRIVDRAFIEKILDSTDIILPRSRNYYIETSYGQYVHAHHKEDLDFTRNIINERFPSYIPAYDKAMNSTKGHRFNMFIMKREYFDEYMKWLFDILFELEKRLDISSYSTNDQRVFGFVSERLLDVWIDTNKYSYVELPVQYMENQNWFVKGGNFLKRKFIGKKQ